MLWTHWQCFLCLPQTGPGCQQVTSQFNSQATIGRNQPNLTDQTADELEDFAAMPWLLERLCETQKG